jgi:hypothetical protein
VLALALRGTEAGLVWAVDDGVGFRIFLTRADLATGGAGTPTAVAEGEGSLIDADLLVVPEGHLIAWSEEVEWTQRTAVLPTRFAADLGVTLRTPILVFEGAMLEAGPGVGSTSLAFDGLDAYVGVSVMSEVDAMPEVRVQRLACHR